MADVKNIVTLGIGAAPGGLVWFLTGGLEAGVVVAAPIILTVPYENRTLAVAREVREIDVPYENYMLTVAADVRTLDVPQESRTLTVPVRRSAVP